MIKRNILVILVVLTVLFVNGCVERLIKITTAPPGALVWLNGEEIGVTPLTVPFTWYGRYDLTLRKDGFQTIKTARETPVPFYQWPGIDFFSEVMLPANLVDQHDWHYSLTAHRPTDPNALIQRAQNLRTELLYKP